MKAIKNVIEDYPVNLLDDIANVGNIGEELQIWSSSLPPDLLPSVEYAIATLTEREADVIHMRYKQGMSWDQIGAEYSVTRERVRQVGNKALRKLSHPSRRLWLVDGVQGVIAKRVISAQENIISNELKKAIDNIASISNTLSETMDKTEFKTAVGECDNCGCNLDMSIETLDLSVRAFNCLYRKDIKTLRKLINLSLDELAKIRNLGERSYNEIVEAVHKKGLRFKGEGKNNS